MNIGPCTLEGQHVRLEPLTLAHTERLTEIGCDERVWRYLTSRFESRADVEQSIRTALEWQEQGTAIPFATIDKAAGLVVGSTRFANIVHEHKRAEIGWTWISPQWQRTAINTE